MLKAECAGFLLEAIGEISESTIAEAALPVRSRSVRSIRRPALLVAAAILLLAVAATVMVTLGLFQSNATSLISPPAAEDGVETVSMDYAINAAMKSLRDTGVTATLSRASLMTDTPHPYYLVKLLSKDGSYDCSVDAESGKVTDISYRLSPTEAKANESNTDETKRDAAETEADSPDPADSVDVMPDDAEIAAAAENAEKRPASRSVTVIPKTDEAPTSLPSLYDENGEKQPIASVSNDTIEEKKRAEEKSRSDYVSSSPYYGLSGASPLSGLSGYKPPYVNSQGQVIYWDPNAEQ